MQISEYIQIACVLIGLALIAWVKLSYVRRTGEVRGTEPYSEQENKARYVGYAFFAVAVVFIFFPFG